MLQKKSKMKLLLVFFLFIIQINLSHVQSQSISFSPRILDGSGTNWLPDSSPIRAYQLANENLMLMIHGSASLRYTAQNIFNDDKRGESALDGPNWIMSMFSYPLLSPKNRFTLRTMLSLDPLTEGDDGYPLLFQTGETWNNQPLIDRQHPHDFIMELAILEQWQLTPEIGSFIYFALPGEPALGPTVYMHRPLGDIMLDAILGHHTQDATHITFGVATVGIIINDFKIDGSIFTGREPNENRWDFDKPRFDSYSGRLSWNPGIIDFQVSAGFIHSPEALEPDEDVIRFTNSSLFNFKFNEYTHINSSVVWSHNAYLNDNSTLWTHSSLFESMLRYKRYLPYGRYEFIQRKADDLGLEFLNDDILNIHNFTLGLGTNVSPFKNLDLILGVQSTINFPEKKLQDYYGKIPISGQIFLKLSPPILNNENFHRHH